MRSRNNTIKVMLNDEELECLNKQIENSGLNKSVLIRKLISGVALNLTIQASINCYLTINHILHEIIIIINPTLYNTRCRSGNNYLLSHFDLTPQNCAN